MKNLTLIIFLVGLCNFGYAQQDTSKRSTSTVFFGGKTDEESSTHRYNSHVIKLNISGMFSGCIGLNYEKELGELFSVELGGGITTRNYVGNILMMGIMEEENRSQNSPNFIEDFTDEYDEDFEFDRRKAKLGYFATIMPRFYYTEDGIDGSYFGLNLQYRHYKMEAFGLSPSDAAYGSFVFEDGINRQEFDKQLIAAFAWGYQSVYDKTVMDYFCSLGLRSNKGERIDTGYKIDNSSLYERTAVIGNTMRDISRTTFFLEMGVRFGFWWN